jgi:class 3 adenylate cyclase/tetratricopeptide (TPR) repeat protein
MKCPKCQFENVDDSTFCGACGSLLELDITCPNCGEKPPQGYRFCNRCGYNLSLPSESAPAPKELSFDEKLDKIQRYLPKGLTEKILAQRDRIEGERKQVTVMFCDMEGFTRLSESLGPEEAYGVMDQVYEILIHKVHDYEGTVNEMTGDGIMALFGAPIALEDAPQRAIRSAYAIHREMVKFSENIKQEKGGIQPIRMRAGIHTGPVVVGTLGNDLRVEFKVVGDTVNLASRMEGLAEPGATYVTEEVFRQTEGLFQFEILGEKEVKGKEEPIPVYRVIAPSSRKTRFDVSAHRGFTPFVGRERELELLLDCFERSKGGRGQAISIVADAGVGKSRLLYEFRKAVANEDVTFLEGRCLSYSRGTAYHLHIDILKANFDIGDGDEDAHIKEKVKRGLEILGADNDSILPYLLELLSVKESGIDEIPLSPEARKDRTIDALKQLVLRGSEVRTLILAYEDLHWVDRSSEEVLKTILESIPGARVLLIFAYRPEFVHTWGGKSYHNQVTLNRLSNRESLEMVRHLLGMEHIDSVLDEFILDRTEGIPFFIEEFIRSLRDLQIIEKKDNAYRIVKDIEEVAIPSTIQDVIMARVDSLPERAKGVLQTGAVIGREFSHDLLKKVINLPEPELLSHISVLKDSELLYERGIYPQLTYVFKHAFTQEVAYNSLLHKRTKEIHQETGKAIEKIYPERLEEFYETLAHHYTKTDDSQKACDYLKLSGNKSTQNYSAWEAFHFYKQAIDILNQRSTTEQNTKEQIEVRLLITVPMHILNHPEDSLKILQEGERLSKEIDDKESLSIFSGKLGVYHAHHGNPVLAVKYVERPFKEAEKDRDIELMAKTACDLCNAYYYASQFKKIIDVSSKVLVLLEEEQRQHDFFGFRYNVYSGLCAYNLIASGMLGDFKELEVLYKKGFNYALEANSIYGLGMVEHCYVQALNTIGKASDAVNHGQQSIKHLEQAQGILLLGVIWGQLGYAHYLIGDLKAAKECIEKAIRFQKDHCVSIYTSMNYLYLGIVHFELGDLKKAHDLVHEALRLSEKSKEGHWEGISRVWLARISGKAEGAPRSRVEEFFSQGAQVLNELKLRPWSAQGYLFWGEYCVDTGLREKALEYLKNAEQMFQEMEMDYWLGQNREILERL